MAERGNLKAPEVIQLNYRLTTKLHKAKVCDAPRPPGAMRRKRVGNGSNIEKSHRVLVALGLAVYHRFRPKAEAREPLAYLNRSESGRQ